MGSHCSCRRSFYFLEGRVAGFALGLANFLDGWISDRCFVFLRIPCFQQDISMGDDVSTVCLPTRLEEKGSILCQQGCVHVC